MRRFTETGIDPLMFTGIIEDSAVVLQPGARLQVRTALDLSDTKLGDSIAVDGCCLTVVEMLPGVLAFDLGPETLAVTTLGDLGINDRVHLERALRLSDRLGGHLVAGHVDAIGTIVSLRKENDALIVRVSAPTAVTRYCVAKGSVCLDGVSLTLNVVDDAGFAVGLIPHTLEVTALGALSVGDRVNLEADLVGKYVEKLLVGRTAST